MSKTLEITIQLDPDTYIILDSLCQFYQKTQAEVIDMALTQMAAQAKLITETIVAKRNRGK